MLRVKLLAGLVLVSLMVGCAGMPLRWTSSSNAYNSGKEVNTGSLGQLDVVLRGIRLGMTVEAAKGMLNNPISGRSQDGTEFWRQGEQHGVSFSHKNGVVWYVSDSIGPTPRGLHIGDSGKRVEQLYGQPAEVQKHGWWSYSGEAGFSLTVVVRDDQVRQIFIENRSLVEVHPTPGRDLQKVGEAEPFGSTDYSLADVVVCSLITDLRTDPRFVETTGSAERGTTIGFVTRDGQMRVDPAPGSNRVQSVEVVGGPYETTRGVRVGDPIGRAKTLYDGTSHLSDDNVSLTFFPNMNGAITSILLRCISD